MLRRAALESHDTKRDNLDGAAAYAAFAPRLVRSQVVRALMTYQMALDYIDTVCEQSDADPMANGRQLNQALLKALQPHATHDDYYALQTRHQDGGYLDDLVDACRRSLRALPSYHLVAPLTLRITTRIVAYQTLNHGDESGRHDAFANWAKAQMEPCRGLYWWEVGAAAGSHIPVLALIAAAADPRLTSSDASAVEGAYFPWIAALSTLLDSLVDHRQDAEEGQRSLIDYYGSPEHTAMRMQFIAAEALRHTERLVDRQHTMILVAMACFFYFCRGAEVADVRLVTGRILDAMGEHAMPAVIVLDARRRASDLVDAVRAHRPPLAPAA